MNWINKTVLITGGTGTIGYALTKELLKRQAEIIIFSRDEYKQHVMNQHFNDKRIHYYIGDIRDYESIYNATKYVNIVIHAAALKHIQTGENYPNEIIETNVRGTENLIKATKINKNDVVIGISSDKAVSPINLYGCTKMILEKLFVHASQYKKQKPNYNIIRYGNVIGSRGSLVEYLEKNRNAKNINITDKLTTRFWLTKEQAVDYILDEMLYNYDHDGLIFIPKIKSAITSQVFDLFCPDAEQVEIGIQSGEKLHELLYNKEESRDIIETERFFVKLPKHKKGFNFHQSISNGVEKDELCSSNSFNMYKLDELPKLFGLSDKQE